MTNWREDTLPDFSKYSSEWKNVATYYNQLVGKYIVDFLVNNPVVGQYYRSFLTIKLNTKYITLIACFHEKNSVFKIKKSSFHMVNIYPCLKDLNVVKPARYEE